MTTYRLRDGCAALVLVFAAQTAQADLTAQDVWSDVRDYLSDAGYQITHDETVSGDRLTVSNLQMLMQSPEDQSTFQITIPSLVFDGRDDGTVKVGFSDTIPMVFSGVGSDKEEIRAQVDYIQTGETLVVSGTADNMVYDYDAAQLDVVLGSLEINGEAIPSTIGRFEMTMTDVASTTTMMLGDLRTYTQDMQAGALRYDMGFADPETADMADLAGELRGLDLKSTGALPAMMDPSNFQTMLSDGFSVAGSFSYASGSSVIQVVGDGENFAAKTSSQGGEVGVQMNRSAIVYDVTQSRSNIEATLADLPFPIAMEMADAAFNIQIPVAKSDAEQDFGFAMRLGDFTVSDAVWNTFDPANVLPRNPATVVVDLAGKARVLFDLLDPEVAEMLENSAQAPGELNTLSINQILVSMVGARLSGQGAFTFDNTDLVTFDGMPRPMGELNLQLVGANGLLDRLIQMGFVSDQDAMGARMMLGLLAVPGGAEDTLTSKLEINAEGHVLANGQRIQ